MISKNFCTNPKNNNHPPGDLITNITSDGSFSLINNYFKESFHSNDGARKEAEEKFVIPSQINKFTKENIYVLDVCIGLGYNTACLIEKLMKTPIKIYWWGLEIDQRPLQTALRNPLYKKSWSSNVLEILESINNSGKWQKNKSEGNVLWGDAREKLEVISDSLKFDLILHDAFSPKKCPQLWSEEFLNKLAKRLAPNGKLITYSSSAAIRATLKRSGLNLKSIKPINSLKKKWSIGTIAINQVDQESNDQFENWEPLSVMEQEHLLTNASIPYRDPNGNGSVEEILKRRAKEQSKSNLASTNSWKKRWKIN